MRRDLDREGEEQRGTLVAADAGYNNGRMIKNLPARTTFIGRLRHDAKPYHPPLRKGEKQRGRRLVYGERATSPEEIRQDDAIPLQMVSVHAAGRIHDFRIKTLCPLLYRKPACLISTDPDLEVEKVIQYYVWRWDLEVNFREEKQLIGMGEAQVRSGSSVEVAPAFAVASYAMLLLAAQKAFGQGEIPGAIPPPKWRESVPKPRATTTDFIQQLRAELWGEALRKDNFSGFANEHPRVMKPEKIEPDLTSAVLYAA